MSTTLSQSVNRTNVQMMTSHVGATHRTISEQTDYKRNKTAFTTANNSVWQIVMYLPSGSTGQSEEEVWNNK